GAVVQGPGVAGDDVVLVELQDLRKEAHRRLLRQAREHFFSAQGISRGVHRPMPPSTGRMVPVRYSFSMSCHTALATASGAAASPSATMPTKRSRTSSSIPSVIAVRTNPDATAFTRPQ